VDRGPNCTPREQAPESGVATGAAERPRLYTPHFVTLLCLQLAFGFSFSTFYLLPKFMAVELRATPVAIGAVTGMFGLSGVLAIPLVGASIDRVERHLFLRAGSALMVVGAFGFLFVDDAGVLAGALRLVQGFAWSMVFTAGLALTSDTSPPQRMAEALGVLGSANLVMNAIAPAVAEPIAERAGYGPAFALAGVAALVATGLSLRLAEPAAVRRNQAPSIAAFLRRPATRMMAPIIGTAGAAFGVMFTFYQPAALEVGIHQVRGFFVAYTAGALLVRLALARVADRLGRHAVAVSALTLYGASVIGMHTITPLGLAVFGGLFGVAHGFFFPAFNAMVMENAPSEERGKLMTLSNGFFSIGSASVMGLGFAVERLGYGGIFVLAGIAALAVNVLLLAWPTVTARRS
jgi:MFS family permease